MRKFGFSKSWIIVTFSELVFPRFPQQAKNCVAPKVSRNRDGGVVKKILGSVLNLIPFLEKGDEGLVSDIVIGDKVQPISTKSSLSPHG